MKKKLMCLALCVVLLLSSLLFAGCSSDEEDPNEGIETEASRNTITLNMYVITEDNTSTEAAKAVEEEINKITKSKFKTKLNIKFYTEAEYYSAVEQAFENKETENNQAREVEQLRRRYIKDNQAEFGREEAEKRFYQEYPEYEKYAVTTADPLAETTPEETYFNPDTNLLELKYPESNPYVVDIFFLSDYDRLLDYIEKDWVTRLDDELTSGSKKLKYYISDVFLSSVKIDSATYAIPNNHTIGEYTYMMVNKELLAKYYYNINNIRSLTDCKEFLADIAAFEPDVVPINGSPEFYNVLYWSIDPDTLDIKTDEFSIIGTTHSATATLGTQIQFTSLFATRQEYRDQLLYNKLYEELNYYKSDVSEDTECAIKLIKGGAELEKIYSEKYEMVVLETPRANQSSIFDSMYAVGGYSNDVKRSMEVITYLNTNAELRNLLLYGIEGINYTLNENNQVIRTENNDYWMDMNKTGNTFIAYPEVGTDVDIWTYGKIQNRDATTDLILGFSYKDEKVNTELIRKIDVITASIKERIDACKTHAELNALVNTLMLELRGQSNPDIREYISMIAEPNESGESTPYVILYEWMKSMGFITEE